MPGRDIPNYRIRPRKTPYDRIPDPNDPIIIRYYDPKENVFSESPSIPTAQPIRIEHSGDDQGLALEQPSSTIPADLVGPPFNTEAGPPDSEEDESYYDFQDGFDNPVAVQRIAKMVDAMTGLEVATRIAENGRYETISELRDDLNNGQALWFKAEDVEKTSRVLKKLVQILKKGMRVKAVSFSKVLGSDCLRMGLDTESTPIIPTAVANQKIMVCLSKFVEINLPSSNFSTTLQNEFNNSTILHLAATIAQISRNDNDDSEAFSRMIIDQFALPMHSLFNKLGLASYKVAEFRIASAEDPVEILRCGFRTILTGYTDYGLFLRVGSSQEELKELCDNEMLRGVKVLLRRIRFYDVQVFLIEAKSKEYSQSLATCLPQMGTECIATMNSTRQKEMTWCLSTGSTWIFGTTQLNADGTYVMRMTEPMKLELRNADTDSNLGIVRSIFWALICWTFVPAAEIIEEVFENQESET